MRSLLLTIGAIGAWVLYWHIGLLAILIYIWAAAMASTANTAKARSTEARVAALVSSAATTNTALAATTTTANATAATVATGSTGTANIGTTSTADGSPVTSGPDAGDCQVLTTSGASAGTAHTHTMPSLPNDNHYHDFAGHTHDFGGHTHPLS